MNKASQAGQTSLSPLPEIESVGTAPRIEGLGGRSFDELEALSGRAMRRMRHKAFCGLVAVGLAAGGVGAGLEGQPPHGVLATALGGAILLLACGFAGALAGQVGKACLKQLGGCGPTDDGMLGEVEVVGALVGGFGGLLAGLILPGGGYILPGAALGALCGAVIASLPGECLHVLRWVVGMLELHRRECATRPGTGWLAGFGRKKNADG